MEAISDTDKKGESMDDIICPDCKGANEHDANFCRWCGLNLHLILEFQGSAKEYFRIWIVNLCLTLITLGIFSAWAKVRKKRYFYSHTILDGTPFQYLGQPVPILKGRIIAAIAFSVYYASGHFFISLLPYVFAVGMIVAPWMIVRSAAFNARYSAFRNITFSFNGNYLKALKAIYAWGLIPAFAIGMVFNWWEQYAVAGVLLFIFGLAFPLWLRKFKNFIIGHTSYGGKWGEFSATGWQFFKVYFSAGLIVVIVGVVAAILAAATFAFVKKFQVLLALTVIPIYAGYVLAYAYVQAHGGNLVWNNTRLGPLRFRSTLRARGMSKLYITNALAIIISLGLLTPWAVMRTLKYRADNMHVLRGGDLADFQGSETSAVQAVGAELGDFFDVDISI